MSRWSDNYDGWYINRAYMIVPIDEVTDGMIEAAIQNLRETLRRSLDGTRVLLKFHCTDNPDNDPSMFADYEKLSHPQAIALLSGEDWTESHAH